MKFISPTPRVWHEIHQALEEHWRVVLQKNGNSPPLPLILGGWDFSNDHDKRERWNETILWATINACLELIPVLKENEQYSVNELSDWIPHQHSNWNEDQRNRPSEIEIANYLLKIKEKWASILDRDFGLKTTPIEFSGKKLRRLKVSYLKDYKPPWGSWTDHLANGLPSQFTVLRKKVNSIIVPHEVDHIDFTLKK